MELKFNSVAWCFQLQMLTRHILVLIVAQPCGGGGALHLNGFLQVPVPPIRDGYPRQNIIDHAIGKYDLAPFLNGWGKSFTKWPAAWSYILCQSLYLVAVPSRGFILGLWSACASVGNIIGALMVSAVLDYGYEVRSIDVSLWLSTHTSQYWFVKDATIQDFPLNYNFCHAPSQKVCE